MCYKAWVCSVSTEFIITSWCGRLDPVSSDSDLGDLNQSLNSFSSFLITRHSKSRELLCLPTYQEAECCVCLLTFFSQLPHLAPLPDAVKPHTLGCSIIQFSCISVCTPEWILPKASLSKNKNFNFKITLNFFSPSSSMGLMCYDDSLTSVINQWQSYWCGIQK